MLIVTPSAPAPPAKRAGSDVRLAGTACYGTSTVFHVVPNWRASPEIGFPRSVTTGSPSGSPAHPNAPGAHLSQAVLQECHCVSAGTFRHIQPVLCHRDPRRDPAQGAHSPPRARGRCDHPTPRQPATKSQDSMSSTRASLGRVTLIRWKPPNRRADSGHRSQRSS